MGPEDLSAEDFERLARIAHRYYVDERTQEEIAREFSLSRPKVQRLLERARWSGIVDIRIATPPWLNLDLETRLREAFRLADAIVAPRRADPQSQREAVGRSAAQLLERRLRDASVIAVGHGRDAAEVPRFFRPARRVDCEFVSAMGGSPRVATPTNPNEIGHALAAASGGRSRSLYAPAYVEHAYDRARFMQQDAIAHTLSVACRADTALVGIGGVDDDCTMVRSGCLSVAEVARLRDQGAVGDILGNYVDLEGRVIESPHSERLIALSIHDLQRIETVIAVVSEAEKPRAILGVLRAGVVDVLVIDEGNAQVVLDMAERGSDVEPAPVPAKRRVTVGGDVADLDAGGKGVIDEPTP
jgi:DNA-binding transcriptional regulator LsrR (DeoR family)